jgi:hypothetical protein
MDQTHKMLQILIDGQATMRQEIKDFKNEFNNKIDAIDKKLTNRIDRLGESLAYLEDDAPTRKEYHHLEKRVTKIEKKLNLT